MMKLSYFLVLSILHLTSCATLIKDEPEIEKIIEDGTKEIIEDLEKHG